MNIAAKVSSTLLLLCLAASGASAALRPSVQPSGLLVANCLSKDGLEIAEVFYANAYGTTAPVTIEVSTDDVMGNFACNSTDTACAGISETTGEVITATLKETTANTFVFSFQNNFVVTCTLPI